MKRFKYVLVSSVLLMSISTMGYGQEYKDTPIRDRMFFGGNLSLQFGSATFIEISPSIGYKLTKRLSLAGGPIYMYYKDKRYEPDFSTHIYGSHLYTRFLIYDASDESLPINFGGGLFAQVEYEWLSMENKIRYGYGTTGRFDLHSIYVGGGLQYPIGYRSSIFILFLYNLNQSPYSLYSNPIIRFGFHF